MSSSLNRVLPSEGQLRVARDHHRLLDALTSPERQDPIAADGTARAGVHALIDAGLAVEKPTASGTPGRLQLTNCGLAAALAILDDSR